MAAVGAWLSERSKEGVAPHEIGVFVRSDAELERARAAVAKAGLPFKVLDEHVETVNGQVSVCTMHLAKGLEFRAVVVMTCDDEVIPLQSRIETAGDAADLEEVYNTERHLLYVACTRARDQLIVTVTELRDSEEGNRTLVEFAPDAILVVDERGIIQQCNPAGEVFFGYSVAELIGRNISLLMPSPDREAHDGYIARYLAGGEPRILGLGRDVVARRKDGSQLGITRTALYRILNDHAGISPEMARRIEAWLGSERGGRAEMWLGLQMDYDLWIAEQRPAPRVERAPEMATEMALV